MALDVHLLTIADEHPSQWPLCQFEEPVHSAVFFGGVLDVGQYPQLQRMQDYYADARYGGDELTRLLEELSGIFPKFSEYPEVQRVLRRFQEVCRTAASEGKVVLCLCD